MQKKQQTHLPQMRVLGILPKCWWLGDAAYGIFTALGLPYDLNLQSWPADGPCKVTPTAGPPARAVGGWGVSRSIPGCNMVQHGATHRPRPSPNTPSRIEPMQPAETTQTLLVLQCRWGMGSHDLKQNHYCIYKYTHIYIYICITCIYIYVNIYIYM